MMNTTIEFNSNRSPVYGRGGMVATSQPLAVAAGLLVLEQGGNAADAAVATAAALNVTEPTSTGLGGDAFALFYQASSKKVFALNGSGRAPQALTLERLQQEGFGDHIPPHHAFTVTVPGVCAAWCDLVERFGRLNLAKNLAPAIRLAEEGFPVAPVTAYFWQHAAQDLLKNALNGVELTLNGKGPDAGEIFCNPGLAHTLRLVAEGGKRAFYHGAIAEAVVAILKEAGGCMALDDLALHTSTWEEPLSTTYRHLRIWECPPNGQGLTALLALNILEGFDLAALPPLSPERLHLEIEALRLAFADGRSHIADPAFCAPPLDALLSKDYAAERRRLIDPRQAAASMQPGLPPASDTVYLSVVDAQGNACSFINSNYMGFGSGIVPRGFGFSLQNRGLGFSLDPSHPNHLQPGKRPYHTIIPALATDASDGSLFASFGVIGGYMQPQGHTQVLIALEDDGLDPQQALDRPRFMVDCIHPENKISLEEGISIKTMAALAQMGHTVIPVSGMARSLFGRGQVILRQKENGVLCGGSDPRADGCAMALL